MLSSLETRRLSALTPLPGNIATLRKKNSASKQIVFLTPDLSHLRVRIYDSSFFKSLNNSLKVDHSGRCSLINSEALFLDASSHLYDRMCPSVSRLVDNAFNKYIKIMHF